MLFSKITPRIMLTQDKRYFQKELENVISVLGKKEAKFLQESIRSGATNLQNILGVLDDQSSPKEENVFVRVRKAIDEDSLYAFSFNLEVYLNEGGSVLQDDRRISIRDMIRNISTQTNFKDHSSD